jgi:hypothetical protein
LNCFIFGGRREYCIGILEFWTTHIYLLRLFSIC